MQSHHVYNYLRGAGWSAILCGLGFAALPWAEAKPGGQTVAPSLSERGALSLMLHRGAYTPFETSVIATPNNCAARLELDLAWDQDRDKVRVRLRGKKALPLAPHVERSEGVDFSPNPQFPEPEDIYAGRHQLWISGAAGPITAFYYDATTHELLGGGPDFSPPEDAISLEFPTTYMFSSPFFQPSSKGDVNLDWSFPYSSPHRGDRPEFSYHLYAFVPPDLCNIDPYRIDKTSLRPWISEPLPREDAKPWSDYLSGGLLFHVSVEPGAYFTEPPRTTSIASYSGATTLGGGVPRDWKLDLDAALAGLAPPIIQWTGAGQCEQHFDGFHLEPGSCEPEPAEPEPQPEPQPDPQPQ